MAEPPIGLFDGASAFGDFLRRLESEVRDDDRFVGRNFRLDEGVRQRRRALYEKEVAGSTWESWAALHRRYLRSSVSWDRVASVPPEIVEAGAVEAPATFGQECLTAYFGDISPGTSLVHVTTIERLARHADLTPHEARASLSRSGGLDAVLLKASINRERLCDFVAIWDDLRDLLPAEPSAAPPGWANDLRDRLGLIHYRPRGGLAQEIFVFVFPANRVPRLRGGDGERAIAIPTVLDFAFYTAFCPAPLGAETGRIVNLGSSVEGPELREPIREMLIPPIRLRESDLHAVGEISAAPPELPRAREAHLLMIQDEFGRPDYALRTDPDLT